MKLVSVTICSYNSADTLAASLESALDQTIPPGDYEVLLVDDGSTDRTPTIGEEYRRRYSNFCYLRRPKNQGLVAACNYGLASAQGKYFIRLDADDAFDPQILSCCLEAMEADETDMVYSDRYDVVLEDGSQFLVQIEPFNLFKLLAAGTMFRTQLMRKIGGYRPLFWEEYDLYIRYLQCSQRSPVRIPRPMYYYRRHAGSMTADPAKVREGWEELKRVWGRDILQQLGWAPPESEVS